MLFRIIIFCVVTLTCILCSTERLRWHKHLKGLLGNHTTIQCNYTGDDWLVVQWRRKTIDRVEFQTLMTLRDSPSEILYSRDMSSSLRQKMNGGSVRVGNTMVFSLDISPLECSDKGVYRCDIMTMGGPLRGQTHLQLQAYPLKPNIYYDVLVQHRNTTVTLHCEGNVGLPPGSLQWYYRPSKKDYFRLVENPPRSTLSLDNQFCSYNAVTFYNVTINEHSNGAVYRCSVNSLFTSSANPKFYDEVTVKLPTLPIPTESPNWSHKYRAEGTKNERAPRPRGSDGNTEVPGQSLMFTVLLLNLIVQKCYILF